MTAPYTQQNYADWKARFQQTSAVGGLLRQAKQVAGVEDSPEQAPQALMAPPPQPELPPVDPHEHQRGILGGVRHILGADRTTPEVNALLGNDPSKIARTKPGILGTLFNAVARGKGPQEVQRERARTMLDLGDEKKARDKMARDEAMWANIQQVAAKIPDPQMRLEATARMAQSMGLPQGKDMDLAANRLRPDAPLVVGRGSAVRGEDGSFSIPAPLEPEPMSQLEVQDYLGGKARMKDGVFDSWVIRPPSERDSGVAGELSLQRMATRAQPLALSFQRETERHQIVAEALTTLNGLREPAMAGDGAAQHMLVFSLMKLADPGSAVRQDERADTKNAANVPERLRAQYNRLLGGGGPMSPQTVQDFLSTVDSTKKARIRDFDTLRDQFNKRAGIIKVDPELVTSDYFAALREDAATPSGKSMTRAEFNQLSPAAQKAATDGGYTIRDR